MGDRPVDTTSSEATAADLGRVALIWARYRSVWPPGSCPGPRARFPRARLGVRRGPDLHLVDTLDQTYAAAGLVVASATVAAAVSGPWRGRLVDRIGLRRTVGPALVIAACCWSTAPFVGYWPLLALATVSNLFLVPSFAIIRQAIMVAVPPRERRTAISSTPSLPGLVHGRPDSRCLGGDQWPTPWVLLTGHGRRRPCALVNRSAAAERASTPVTSSAFRDARVPATFIALCLGATTATVISGARDRRRCGNARLRPHLANRSRARRVGSCFAARRVALRQAPSPISVSYLSRTGPDHDPNGRGPGDTKFDATRISRRIALCPDDYRNDRSGLPRRSGGRAGRNGVARLGALVGSAFGAPITGAAIDTWGFAGGFIVCALVGLVVALILLGVIGDPSRAQPPREPGLRAVQVSAEAQVTAEAQVPAPNTASTAGIAVR